MSSAILNARDL